MKKALIAPSLRVAVYEFNANSFIVSEVLFRAIFCWILKFYLTAVLPTLFFNSKVDDGSLGGDLWCVMGITQFCCDIEMELWTVLHFLVTKPNQPTTTCRGNTITL